MGGRPHWAGEPDGLVGRDDLLDRLRELLVGGARAAVVTGLPGAGKSAVLRYAGRAAAAEGWTVLQVTGHPADRELPYGALVDLLPVEQLTVGDPLRLRLDVLARLEQQAGDGPLLLLLDDVQWFDDSSLAVLAFIANRLAPADLSFLAAARGGQAPGALHGLPVVALPPLTDTEATLVLRRSGLELDAMARQSVVDQAAGIPLALLELGRAASSGADGMPSSVEVAFAAELAELPEPTRWVLLLAAAGALDLRVLGRVVRPAELVADLAPAESSGLVHVADRQLRFRHPLARAAAYSSATTAQRLAAHEALAAAYADDPDRSIWHRAEATVVPDADVAAALAEAALRAQARLANAESGRLMARAAELSPDRHDREERLLQSIALSIPSGHFEGLAQIAGRLRDESTDPSVRARASHFLAYALTRTMRQRAARVALQDALEQLIALDQDYGWATLTTLAVLTYSSGEDPAGLAEWLARFDREVPALEGPHGELIPAARAWVAAVVDPIARPPELIALVRGEPVLDGRHPLAVAREVVLGGAAWLLDESAVAARRLTWAVASMRRSGSTGELSQTLTSLALAHTDLGAYDEADTAARMLIDLAEAEHLSHTADNGREVRARIAGLRGDAAAVRALCGEILTDLEVGESLALEINVRVAMSYALFGENDHLGAWDQLRGLFRVTGEPVHVHISYRHLGDVVAAAVRAGSAAEIEPVLAIARERLSGAGTRHRLLLARASALVAGEDAEPLHVAATTDGDAGQWPFELANARLEYGVWLRRRHRTADARRELQAAYDLFERIGTRAWADLARTELRAAGVVTDAAPSAWRDLTSQERQVVRLAASGMTNREIGASLYLSPRTVSAHLYNAFPKLGVTARAQLRDIVEAREQA